MTSATASALPQSTHTYSRVEILAGEPCVWSGDNTTSLCAGRCSVLFSESDTPLPLSVQLSNSSNTSSAVHVLGPGGQQLPRPVACPLQLPAASCQLRCRDQVARALVCTGQQDRSQHALSLWLYMALRVMYSFCLGTTFLLIDSAVLAYCAEYTGLDYGFQRLWGALAALVVSPLAGFVMDVLSTDGVTNFR